MMPLILSITPGLCQENGEVTSNFTDPNKDMYVIHATVYQVGIITNKTDDDALNATTGNQEAITFYHTNGSNIDLSQITSPLLTNITAQSLIGVAPKADDMQSRQLLWSDLNALSNPNHNGSSDAGQWTVSENDKTYNDGNSDDLTAKLKKSSGDNLKSLFKRDLIGNDTVKIVRGMAAIPEEAGVQSIAFPPLLTLNNNFSDIPIPIPNTSVVHYAKINTLVRSP
ncbi:uncharacterized protein LOC106133765 [Amyelois transitella]|uniref:uncharacterized protein LOC106133765 n=1 Tax=Amyelois transitella TaxID=680683 RepID=UPI00298FA353|nr:uncharacterized protein LOC106133765 [Amyelois transitella]